MLSSCLRHGRFKAFSRNKSFRLCHCRLEQFSRNKCLFVFATEDFNSLQGTKPGLRKDDKLFNCDL